MSGPVPIPGGPAAKAQPLSARRCARHGEREAVARCPACGGHFCRECVVEHDGRLLCASCLAKLSVGRGGEAPKVWRRRLVGAGGLVAGVLVLWTFFYAVGFGLSRVPPDFHDGTIWKLPNEP